MQHVCIVHRVQLVALWFWQPGMEKDMSSRIRGYRSTQKSVNAPPVSRLNPSAEVVQEAGIPSVKGFLLLRSLVKGLTRMTCPYKIE